MLLIRYCHLSTGIQYPAVHVTQLIISAAYVECLMLGINEKVLTFTNIWQMDMSEILATLCASHDSPWNIYYFVHYFAMIALSNYALSDLPPKTGSTLFLKFANFKHGIFRSIRIYVAPCKRQHQISEYQTEECSHVCSLI